MKKIILITFLLSLLNSIILFNQKLGINVLIFTIPLLIALVYIMKENKVIINKKGLLFIIPIIVLSSTYFIYDNSLKYLNILVIPILYLLMYIFTIKPQKLIFDTVIEIINLIVKPLNYIGTFVKKSMNIIFNNKKLSPNTKKVVKSTLLVVPIVLVVTLLLMSADKIFNDLFDKIFIFENISFDNILSRIICFILLFLYLGSTLYFISSLYLKEERIKTESKEKDPLTIKILLTTLNVIYVIFDIIQINSLLLHRVSSGFNYAEYARSGFFQLMVISIINIVVILFSKKCKEDIYVKIMSIMMALLTYIIIISSFYRMYLYEQAYGYTLLRLGVYTILITEAILFIPTIIYIINKKINILNWYLIITISIYTFINCFSVDNIIAINNIKRYDRVKDIDIDYLMNKNYDNIPILREFLNEYNEEDKDKLRIYIGRMDKRNKTNIFEFNISKNNAKKNSTWKDI